jgi:hypothetical protein
MRQKFRITPLYKRALKSLGICDEDLCIITEACVIGETYLIPTFQLDDDYKFNSSKKYCIVLQDKEISTKFQIKGTFEKNKIIKSGKNITTIPKKSIEHCIISTRDVFTFRPDYTDVLDMEYEPEMKIDLPFFKIPDRVLISLPSWAENISKSENLGQSVLTLPGIEWLYPFLISWCHARRKIFDDFMEIKQLPNDEIEQLSNDQPEQWSNNENERLFDQLCNTLKTKYNSKISLSEGFRISRSIFIRQLHKDKSLGNTKAKAIHSICSAEHSMYKIVCLSLLDIKKKIISTIPSTFSSNKILQYLIIDVVNEVNILNEKLLKNEYFRDQTLHLKSQVIDFFSHEEDSIRFSFDKIGLFSKQKDIRWHYLDTNKSIDEGAYKDIFDSIDKLDINYTDKITRYTIIDELERSNKEMVISVRVLGQFFPASCVTACRYMNTLPFKHSWRFKKGFFLASAEFFVAILLPRVLQYISYATIIEELTSIEEKKPEYLLDELLGASFRFNDLIPYTYKRSQEISRNLRGIYINPFVQCIIDPYLLVSKEKDYDHYVKKGVYNPPDIEDLCKGHNSVPLCIKQVLDVMETKASKKELKNDDRVFMSEVLVGLGYHSKTIETYIDDNFEDAKSDVKQKRRKLSIISTVNSFSSKRNRTKNTQKYNGFKFNCDQIASKNSSSSSMNCPFSSQNRKTLKQVITKTWNTKENTTRIEDVMAKISEVPESDHKSACIQYMSMTSGIHGSTIAKYPANRAIYYNRKFKEDIDQNNLLFNKMTIH